MLNDSTIYDVLIVGAGIAGTSAAVGLNNIGLRVALVDAQNPRSHEAAGERCSVVDFSSRVSAITPANAQWLEQIGMWSLLPEAQVQPYSDMEVWEELGSGRIHFNALEYQCEALGYIVENPALLSACFDALDGSALTDCFFGSRIQTMGFDRQNAFREITFEDGRLLKGRLMIGADGANSFVRKALNIPTREWDYQQSAIVCTVETEMPHSGTAWQRFSEQGPVAYLPLSDSLASDDLRHGHFSSIVWSLDTSQAKAKYALDADAFRAALTRALEAQLGDVTCVSERQIFPLRQRHAKSYLGEQALLLGDAAHTIHPLAGQGLNLGLNDVQVLVSILEEARRKGYELAHPVLLKRYQRQRQGQNLTMMLGMEGFKRLFGSADPLLRLLRNTGVNKVNEHTFIKRQIASRAMGL